MKIKFTFLILCSISILGCTKSEAVAMQTDEPTYKEKLYHYKKMIQIASLAEVKSGIYYDSLTSTNNIRFIDSIKKYNYIYEYTVFTPKP